MHQSARCFGLDTGRSQNNYKCSTRSIISCFMVCDQTIFLFLLLSRFRHVERWSSKTITFAFPRTPLCASDVCAAHLHVRKGLTTLRHFRTRVIIACCGQNVGDGGGGSGKEEEERGKKGIGRSKEKGKREERGCYWRF